MAWLKLVLPYTKSGTQLAVALVLQRRRFLYRSMVFSLPNKELDELGIDRFTKYRASAGTRIGRIDQNQPKAGTRGGGHAAQIDVAQALTLCCVSAQVT